MIFHLIDLHQYKDNNGMSVKIYNNNYQLYICNLKISRIHEIIFPSNKSQPFIWDTIKITYKLCKKIILTKTYFFKKICQIITDNCFQLFFKLG